MHYHEKEAINDPHSTERVMIEMHNAYQLKNVPMSDEQSRYLIMLLMGDDQAIRHSYAELAIQSWQFGGFFKRCELFNIKYETKLKLWLALLNHEYGIGAMILVAYYVQLWAYNNLTIKYATKYCELTLKDVCEHCFPLGVFDKETIHEFWDKQKVKVSPDNLIDHFTACYSFMPIERKEPISNKDHVWS